MKREKRTYGKPLATIHAIVILVLLMSALMLSARAQYSTTSTQQSWNTGQTNTQYPQATASASFTTGNSGGGVVDYANMMNMQSQTYQMATAQPQQQQYQQMASAQPQQYQQMASAQPQQYQQMASAHSQQTFSMGNGQQTTQLSGNANGKVQPINQYLNSPQYADMQSQLQMQGAQQRVSDEKLQKTVSSSYQPQTLQSTSYMDGSLPNANPMDPQLGAMPMIGATQGMPGQAPPPPAGVVVQNTRLVQSGPIPAPYNGIDVANAQAHSVPNDYAYGLGSSQNFVTPSATRLYQERAYDDIASKAVPSVYGAGVFTQVTTPDEAHPWGASGYQGAFAGQKAAQYNAMASTFASPVQVGPADPSIVGLSEMYRNDICSGYDLYQCGKFVYCTWLDGRCRSVDSGSAALYSVNGGAIPTTPSPFIISQSLAQVGDAIVNAVSEVDMCYALDTFYKCGEYYGCEWDGRYCVSSTVNQDSFRDPCSDAVNPDMCTRNSQCTWQPESLRCISHVGASAHAFPMSNRYRARLQIMGEGYTNQFQVPMGAREDTEPVQALRARANEFFLQQYGLDFRGGKYYGGAVIKAAKNNPSLFFQVINADLPYGASLIPRRNRVVFDKFVVHNRPSHATTLRGEYANYFQKYSVPMYNTEILEFGAMHIIDENDNIILSLDYFYNYPIKPNPVGLVGLSAEISSSFGYGMLRGTDVVTPTYDGFSHVDSYYSVIIGSGDANKGSILSTGTVGLQQKGTFIAAGRGAGPYGTTHTTFNDHGTSVRSTTNVVHYAGGDTYAPTALGGSAYGYPTAVPTTQGYGALVNAKGPYDPYNSQIQYSMGNQVSGIVPPSVAPAGYSGYPQGV